MSFELYSKLINIQAIVFHRYKRMMAGIMGKWANIDFKKCDPSSCNGDEGKCIALQVCTHRLLIQEEPFEAPMLLSAKMCVGCGDCVKVCPLNAISIQNGV
ncbi:MAG: 4Fe-4S binding protein [Spirochaetota bacterium]